MKVMNEPFVHINNAWKLVRQTRNSGIDEDIEDMTVVARDLEHKIEPERITARKAGKNVRLQQEAFAAFGEKIPCSVKVLVALEVQCHWLCAAPQNGSMHLERVLVRFFRLHSLN